MNLRIRVGAHESKILGHLPGTISRALQDTLSYDVPGAEFIDSAFEWDGRIRLFKRGSRTFPTGLLDEVQDILGVNGYDPVLDYEYSKDTVRALVDGYGLEESLPLWPFQKDALQQCLDHERGMVQIATGGGKTRVAVHVMATIDRPTVFLVHTKDLLYQAKRTMEKAFGPELVGQVGDGVSEPSHFTVCTIQTLCRFIHAEYVPLDDEPEWYDSDTPIEGVSDMIDRARVAIQDECHRVAAPTCQTVFEVLSNATRRYGLSASPWRDDNATIVLHGVFGPVITTVSASELFRRGYLVRPVIRMLDVPLEPDRATAREWMSVYRTCVVDNDTRNGMGVDAVCRMVDAGKQVLVLVRFIRHGRRVQDMLAQRLGYLPVFLTGSDSSDTRTRVLDEMRNQERAILIATSIADEGLDIPSLSGLVLMGSGKSSVKALQRVGRVLRIHPEKPDTVEVVDFEDPYRYICKHSARRRRLYASEPEWIITDV